MSNDPVALRTRARRVSSLHAYPAARPRVYTESLRLRAAVTLPPHDPTRTEAARLPLNASGVSDAHQIVAYLAELSFQYAQNPAVRTAAIQILNHNNVGNNELAKFTRVLTDWVKRNVVYVPDPEDAEYFIAPPIMIRNIEEAGKTYGDCDDHVLLLASLLKSVGVPVKIVGVSLDDPTRYDHVILAARLHGQWKDIDPCAKDWMQPRYTRRLESR